MKLTNMQTADNEVARNVAGANDVNQQISKLCLIIWFVYLYFGPLN